MVVRELLIGLGFALDDSKLKKADSGINSFKANAESAVATLGRFAATIGIVFGASEIFKAADAWTNVNSRIGLVTSSTAEQATMQEKVYDIAQKTRQEYTATGDLFYKLSRSANQLGASQQDVLDVTETVNKALVIGGASTQEAQATILQLSQALASGRLQGDELRSLSENASLLTDQIAAYYGTTIGGLKEMGKDGELTAEGVFKAILQAKSKMDKQFEKMPVTVEQAVTYALNRIQRLIFNINKETGVFQSIAKGIVYSADAIAGAFERGIKFVGGFTNALKLATAAVVAFGIAWYIVRNGLFTLEMWNIWLQILKISVVNLAKSFFAFLLNPAFWTIAAITLAIMALVLVLEDLYYWITGGDSVLGDYLGTWEEFKDKVNAWMYNLVENLKGYWQNLKDAFFGYIDDMIAKFQEFINKSKEKIGLGGLSLANADMGPFAAAYGVGPNSFSNSGNGGPVIVNVNGDTNIEQNIAGTGQQVADNVGEATGNAVTDANGKWLRSLDNVIYPY